MGHAVADIDGLRQKCWVTPFLELGSAEIETQPHDRTRWNLSLADYFGYRCCDSLGQELLRARKDRFGETPKRLSGSVRNARLTLVCTP
jgi:hypothetical protein